MSVFTLEKVLADARTLVSRLKEHENTADGLLTQTQELSKKVDTMKMYQENLNSLHELARHRPQAQLTLGIFQENSEIGELHQENAELRQALDEHQSAIELIMSQYRHQVTKLVTANRLDRCRYGSVPDQSLEVQAKVNQIYKMAEVMWSAVSSDDSRVNQDTEQLAQLRVENATLRELLSVGRHSLASSVTSQHVQTDTVTHDDQHSHSADTSQSQSEITVLETSNYGQNMMPVCSESLPVCDESLQVDDQSTSDATQTSASCPVSGITHQADERPVGLTTELASATVLCSTSESTEMATDNSQQVGTSEPVTDSSQQVGTSEPATDSSQQVGTSEPVTDSSQQVGTSEPVTDSSQQVEMNELVTNNSQPGETSDISECDEQAVGDDTQVPSMDEMRPAEC